MKIERINPHKLTDDDISQILDFSVPINSELHPHNPPPTFESIKRTLTDIDKFYAEHHFIIKYNDEVIAKMNVFFQNPTPETNDDDLKKANVIIRVKNDRRRESIGSTLLKYALDKVLKDKHKELIIGTVSESGYKFCEHFCGEQVSKSMVSRFFFESADFENIKKINEITTHKSKDIKLTITEGLPKEFQKQYIQLLSDLEREISVYAADRVFNPELFESETLNWIKKDDDWGIKKLFAWGHDENGNLAGFSELQLDPERPGMCETRMT